MPNPLKLRQVGVNAVPQFCFEEEEAISSGVFHLMLFFIGMSGSVVRGHSLLSVIRRCTS